MTYTLTKLFRRRPTQFEMARLIGVVDTDGSGFIDFAEFANLMLMKNMRVSLQCTLDSIRQPLEDLHVLFRSFCVDQGISFVLRQWSLTEFGKVTSLIHGTLLHCLNHCHSSSYTIAFTPTFASIVTLPHPPSLSHPLSLFQIGPLYVSTSLCRCSGALENHTQSNSSFKCSNNSNQKDNAKSSNEKGSSVLSYLLTE